MDIEKLIQERNNQEKFFEKTYEQQIRNEGGVVPPKPQNFIQQQQPKEPELENDDPSEFTRECKWAPSEDDEISGSFIYPIDGKKWDGEDKFLRRYNIVIKFMFNRPGRKIFRNRKIKCQVCSAELEDIDYVDDKNKLIWSDTLYHYFNDHHNPPTRTFYFYIKEMSDIIIDQLKK